MGILPEGMRARLRQLANKAYPAVAVLSSARRAIRLCAVSDPTTAPARRPSTFASYLSDMERWPYPPEGTLLSSDPPVFPGWRGVVLRYVRGPALLGARTTVTRAAMIARRGRRLEPVDGELRLHLASGDRVLPGWHNIDLAGSAADFLWDLRRPLPVAPGSVTAVFSEHFMEHVPLPAAAQLFAQCFDLMAPGAIIRMGVPDFSEYFRDYATGGGMIERARPGRPTRMVALNELVYSYGHACLWDFETMAGLLREIGFVEPRECRYGDSRLDPVPDWDYRSQHEPTLYVEAVRP